MKYDRSYLPEDHPANQSLQRAYDGHNRFGYYEVTIEGVKYVVVNTKRYCSELTLNLQEIDGDSNKRIAYVRTESGWRNATEDD